MDEDKFDQDGFEIAENNKRLSKNRSGAQDTEVKKINPRILLLDFIEGFNNPMKEIRSILDSKTQIRGYVLKTLERGGISIWFRRPGQKIFAEGLLRDELASKLLKKRWTEKKTLFEVVIYGIPRSFNVSTLNSIPGVIRVQQIPGRVILFMNSIQRAKEICSNGVSVDDYYFNVVPFVFRPKVSCPLCGSMDHARCETTKCFRCGEVDHVAKACNKTIRCVRCQSAEHDAWKCPTYRTKLQQATQLKRRSYAEVLGNVRNVPARQHVEDSIQKKQAPPVDVSEIIKGCLAIVTKF